MERSPRPPSPPQPPPGRLASTHTRVPPCKHTSSRKTSGTRSGGMPQPTAPIRVRCHYSPLPVAGGVPSWQAPPIRLRGKAEGAGGHRQTRTAHPGAHWATDGLCGRGRASTPAPRHAPGGGHPPPGQVVRGSSPRLGDRRAWRPLFVQLRQLPAERGPRFKKENGSGGGHGSQRQTAADSHSGCHSGGRAGGWVPQRPGRRTPHRR